MTRTFKSAIGAAAAARHQGQHLLALRARIPVRIATPQANVEVREAV